MSRIGFGQGTSTGDSIQCSNERDESESDQPQNQMTSGPDNLESESDSLGP